MKYLPKHAFQKSLLSIYYVNDIKSLHYENLPMQYTVVFKVVNNEKISIFFLFLLKT